MFYMFKFLGVKRGESPPPWGCGSSRPYPFYTRYKSYDESRNYSYEIDYAQVALPQSSMYGLVFGSSVLLQYPSTKYLAPQTVAPPSITFNDTFAVSQSASYGSNSVLLEDPVYFFNPTLLNGSDILVYNDSKWYSLPAL